MTNERRPIPLRADPGELLREDRLAFHRSVAAIALARRDKTSPDAIVRSAGWDDFRTKIFVRAAMSPTDTTSGVAVTQTHVSPLLLVAPGAAATQLFARCLPFDLAGVLQVQVPHVGVHPQPIFVAEGQPFPIAQATLGASAVVGPARKLMFGVVLTRELDNAVPETASVVLGRLLNESASLSLDSFVFDANAASAARPAGLLNGVAALTASPAATTIADTIANDVGKLAGAFSAAGINSASMLLIANPIQAWQARLALENGPPVLMGVGIPIGTIIAAIPEAIGSAYDGLPETEVREDFSAHYEDAAPQPIVGTGGAVASPVYGTFQKDSLGVRCRVRCAWSALQPGCVQFMQSVNW
jgi:hypothetical protein